MFKELRKRNLKEILKVLTGDYKNRQNKRKGKKHKIEVH